MNPAYPTAQRTALALALCLTAITAHAGDRNDHRTRNASRREARQLPPNGPTSEQRRKPPLPFAPPVRPRFVPAGPWAPTNKPPTTAFMPATSQPVPSSASGTPSPNPPTILDALRTALTGQAPSPAAVSFNDLNKAALAAYAAGDLKKAEAGFRSALQILRQLNPPRPDLVLAETTVLADCLRTAGDLDGAASLLETSTAEFERSGEKPGPAFASMLVLQGSIFNSQGRFDDAERVFRRALTIQKSGSKAADLSEALAREMLGQTLALSGRFNEATVEFRKSSALFQKRTTDLSWAWPASALANALLLQGKGKEANQIATKILKSIDENRGKDRMEAAPVQLNIANIFIYEGDFVEGERLAREGLATFQTAGANQVQLRAVNTVLGSSLIGQKRYKEAVDVLTNACPADAGYRGRVTREAATRSQFTYVCNALLAIAIYELTVSTHDEANASSSRIGFTEAFLAAQEGEVGFPTATALARRGAVGAAKSGASVELVQSYEAKLNELKVLDSARAQALGGDAASSTALRDAQNARYHQLMASIEDLELRLKRTNPLYLELRAPTPVTVEQLQGHGKIGALLKDDEALVLVMPADGKTAGLVFAISKQRTGWARIGMGSEEATRTINLIRAQLDNKTFDPSAAYAPTEADALKPFDPNTSFQLFKATLGAPSIEAVTKDKGTLLFVPSGAFTAFSPSIFVTAATGGPWASPDYRNVAWLLKDKAIAVLPSVSALRTLRELMPRRNTKGLGPLLALADPLRSEQIAGVDKSDVVYRTAVGLKPRQTARLGSVGALEPLPGSRDEAIGLAQVLGVPGDSVLLGRAASETEIKSRSRDGRLAKVGVLEIAAHTVMSGVGGAAPAPALALASPSSGADPQFDDGVLTAGEAAELKLNADWVILSACNSAGGDRADTQGMSGLSRAFFNAGARRLLISNWSVGDRFAASLTPHMFDLMQHDSALSAARALQRATLDVMRSGGPEASNPAQWGPFVLVGDPSR